MRPLNPLARLNHRAIWSRPSVLALIAANLGPLVGVLVFDWEVYPLMLLFWAENVVIGGFNLLKLLTCRGGGPMGTFGKVLYVPFFTVHYGMFTFVHGIFVIGLFGGGRSMGPDADRLLSAIGENQLWLPLLGLVASHGVSFVTNFLGAGEFRSATLPQLMFQPYGRIMILHVTILGGGFLMQALKSPTVGLAFLVVVKCGVDLAAHLRERAKFQPAANAAQPERYS